MPTNAITICPDADRECGIRPAGWCATCPKRAQTAQGSDVLAQLDEAFEREIERVSTLPYNSNTACRHFYAELRKKFAVAVALAAALQPPAREMGAWKALLQDAFDTLESQADSDLDHFEDEEEERECAPMQYAARKIMAAMQALAAAQPTKDE